MPAGYLQGGRMNQPWLKFYPSDWRADPALRMCSLMARGLWMEMLCLMHEAVPRGSLLINGNQVTGKQLAALCGASLTDTVRCMGELAGAGVFSREEDGTIYSRRMRRDEAKSQGGKVEVEKKWGPSNSQTRAQRLSAARQKATHTPEEWNALAVELGEVCLKCGAGEFLKDHITPIYQGGSDGIDNLQPLCRSCNAAKGPDTTDLRPHDWKKRLGERLGKSGETPTLEARNQKPETRQQLKPESKNIKSSGEKSWTPPKHGATGHGKIYLQDGTPEWTAYAADYLETHGIEPTANKHGGRWFKTTGESPLPVATHHGILQQ